MCANVFVCMCVGARVCEGAGFCLCVETVRSRVCESVCVCAERCSDLCVCVNVCESVLASSICVCVKVCAPACFSGLRNEIIARSSQ